MKTTRSLLIGLCAFVFLATCRAEDESAEKLITKTFTVSPGGTINLQTEQGDIEVISGESDQVEIVVERHVSGGSESAAKKLLKADKITFSQNGNEISIESNTEKKSGRVRPRDPILSAHFRIKTPRRFNASLETSGGNISVKDLEGAVDARAAGGNLDFAKIKGSLDAHTGGGNIAAVDCTDKLVVQTSGGKIVIKNFSGPTAMADTSGGNIDVLGCAARLEVKTSGGNITLDEFSGASVYADTGGGNVSIAFDRAPVADCWLRTGGGNITAKLPGTSAVNLNASSDGGSVTSELPVTASANAALKSDRLEGKINGGGPMLSLRTSGGLIQVLKR